MERNQTPPKRGETPLNPAAAARRERRRRRSRKKKRGARLATAFENLGWVLLGVGLGVPLLAALLYLASR